MSDDRGVLVVCVPNPGEWHHEDMERLEGLLDVDVVIIGGAATAVWIPAEERT